MSATAKITGLTLLSAEVSRPGRSLADISSWEFIVYIYTSAMYCAYEYVKRDVREKACEREGEKEI